MIRFTPMLLLSTCLAAFLFGCGSKCGPDNCANGCCDVNNVCQLPAADHCGAQGGLCSTCLGSQQCVGGVCSIANGNTGGNGNSTNGNSTSNGTTTSSNTTGSTGGVPPDCVAQCTSLANTCGADSSQCSELCASITGEQFTCLMNAGCDSSAEQACLSGANTSTTGTTASTTGSTTSGTTGSSGSCLGLGSSCSSMGDCCFQPGGVSCTQRVLGSDQQYCCVSVGQTCSGGNDCCSLSCSSSGACCYDSSWSCSPAGGADADCCSGQCGSNGLCAP